MNVNSVLKKLDVELSKDELKRMKKEAGEFIDLIKKEIKKNKIDADVFVGGSFAKGTLVKSGEYDVDIFVRFDWKYEDLSLHLEDIMKGIAKIFKYPVTKMHGSRDYFRVEKGDLTFEVIPVLRIKKVKEARNVTDQSYFHVNYVKRNVNEKMKREIAFAKKFCKAQRVYGAESYIGGFSGYGLECLMINYGSFSKMLKELSKVKERLVIDPSKQYKNKSKIFVEMNESKMNSPLILVDPTWKERNVLAALTRETFEKFQESAIEFLKKPSEKYFEKKEVDGDELRILAKKKKADFVHLEIETDKQEGDIGGTKMKKFYRYLLKELFDYFEIIESDFYYSGEGVKSDLYLVGKAKKEVVRIGPPISMKKEIQEFKKVNKKTFTKNGFIHSKIDFEKSLEKFIDSFLKKYYGKVKEMSIIGFSFTRK